MVIGQERTKLLCVFNAKRRIFPLHLMRLTSWLLCVIISFDKHQIKCSLFVNDNIKYSIIGYLMFVCVCDIKKNIKKEKYVYVIIQNLQKGIITS